MAITRDFRATVVARAKDDPAFRAALIEEAVQALVDGEFDVARILLRDCINATIGFAELSNVVHSPAKSLMRMVGPKGNPTAEKLVAILRAVQNQAGVRAKVGVEELETV